MGNIWGRGIFDFRGVPLSPSPSYTYGAHHHNIVAVVRRFTHTIRPVRTLSPNAVSQEVQVERYPGGLAKDNNKKSCLSSAGDWSSASLMSPQQLNEAAFSVVSTSGSGSGSGSSKTPLDRRGPLDKEDEDDVVVGEDGDEEMEQEEDYIIMDKGTLVDRQQRFQPGASSTMVQQSMNNSRLIRQTQSTRDKNLCQKCAEQVSAAPHRTLLGLAACVVSMLIRY